MHLSYQAIINEGENQLNEDESHHLNKALRLRIGSTFHITDGKGFVYKSIVVDINRNGIVFKTLEKKFFPSPNFFIHVAISPTKNPDRIEWFVEKSVEIGVQKISFLHCDNSERKHLNLERIEKKAISAMKQSGQAYLPHLSELIDYKSFVPSVTEDEKYIGFVDSNNRSYLMSTAMPAKKYVVLIGPEGDFSTSELELATKSGFIQITLGKTTLRTETAGVAACHILNLLNT